MKKLLLPITLAGIVGCSYMGGILAPTKIEQHQPVVKTPFQRCEKSIEKIVDSTYKLKVEVDIERTSLDKKGNLKTSKLTQHTFGSTFVFGKEDKRLYFATAAHCFPREPQEQEIIEDGELVSVKFKIKNKRYLVVDYIPSGERVLGELKEVKKDDRKDVGILCSDTIDNRFIEPYRFFIEQERLKQGMDIWSVGYPHGFMGTTSFSWGKHLNRGTITSLDYNILPFPSDGIIFTETALDKGMSGGPSFVIIEDLPRIAGVNVRDYNDLNSKYGVATGLLELIKSEGLERLIKK